MTQSKHTQGPWDINAYNLSQVIKVKDGADAKGKNYVDGRHSEKIADCIGEDHFTWGERNANARLIAAAPDLLEALEYIMEVRRMENDENETDIFQEGELKKFQQKARAMALKAIAKARGGQC